MFESNESLNTFSTLNPEKTIVNQFQNSINMINRKSCQYKSFQGNNSSSKKPKFALKLTRAIKKVASRTNLISISIDKKIKIEDNQEKDDQDRFNLFFSQSKNLHEDENIEKKLKVMKRIRIHKDEEMKDKIEKKFENAEQYLQHDDDIVFGQNLISHNYTDFNKKKPHHVVGNLKEFLKLEKKSNNNIFSEFRKMKKFYTNQKSGIYNITLNSDQKHYNNPSNKKNDIIDNENNCEIISDEKIEKFFSERKLYRKFNNNVENEVVQNIDGKFKEQMIGLFNTQNNIMNKKTKAEQNLKNISKYLALKVNKNEDELLLNTTDGFRLKKEIQSAFEEVSEKNTKWGFTNDWIFTLREKINRKKENKKKNNDSFKEKEKENKKEKNKKDIITLSPLSKNSLITPSKTVKNNTEASLTKSFFNPMNTDTRYMQVNNAMFVSLQDPIKRVLSPNVENYSSFDADKIRKPEINQNKYLKNFYNCNPVKEKLKQINYLNDDRANIGDLKVYI